MEKQEKLKKIDFIAKKNGVNIKLIDAVEAEGGKLLITFSSESRVDFRELVKELATTFKTRIELKQVGPRDQAKEVGAIGSCGQVCCCRRYLKEFDNVSIKMAKNQNLALSPNRINGMCGRLLCCLAYENGHYTKACEKMPRPGSDVITPDGKGVACENKVLKDEVVVKLGYGDNITIKTYKTKDLKIKQFNKKEN